MAPGFHEAVLGAPAHRVIVEVTEHDAIDDYPRLVGSLRSFRQNGTRISIDDTNSGYSSLAHVLKLDRDLVSGIDVDPVRRALAAALVSFAAGTGAQIVAEGVETQDELVCSDNSVCVTPKATISAVPADLRRSPSRNDKRRC